MNQQPTAYERKRAERRAAAFTPDPVMERIGQQAREGTLELSPQLRTQLGFYESAKQASKEASK